MCVCVHIYVCVYKFIIKGTCIYYISIYIDIYIVILCIILCLYNLYI